MEKYSVEHSKFYKSDVGDFRVVNLPNVRKA